MHSWNTGDEPELIILWQWLHSQQCQWCLHTLSLYGSTSTNNTQAQVQCRTYVNMNVTKQQYSKPIHTSVVSDSHRRVGKFPGSYNSTVSVHWIRGLYPVSEHSPTCLRWYLHGRHEWLQLSSAVVNHTREHINIPDTLLNVYHNTGSAVYGAVNT